MDTLLNVFYMWIGKDPKWIEDLLLGIVSLIEEIWCHGKVRSRMWSLNPMQNQSTEL